MDPGDLARGISSLALLLVAPGILWSLVLAPRPMGVVRRSVVSVALSVALGVLVTYLGSIVFGIRPTEATILWELLAVCAIPMGLLLSSVLRARLERALA